MPNSFCFFLSDLVGFPNGRWSMLWLRSSFYIDHRLFWWVPCENFGTQTFPGGGKGKAPPPSWKFLKKFGREPTSQNLDFQTLSAHSKKEGGQLPTSIILVAQENRCAAKFFEKFGSLPKFLNLAKPCRLTKSFYPFSLSLLNNAQIHLCIPTTVGTGG